MGIEDAVGTSVGPLPVSWDADRVILYHLGLGAGDRPTQPDETAYVDESRLVVLPTFVTVPAGEASARLLRHPALAHEPHQLLHVGQELVVNRPIPPDAQGSATAIVEAVGDDRRAAQVILAASVTADGKPLATTRFHLRLRGLGGFGGAPLPTAGAEPPDRPPDRVGLRPILPQLAALFRLSADRHPLHIDPAFAARAGHPAPLVAGLCTWGVVAKAAAELMGRPPTALASYRARFDGPVYPGEELAISCWAEGSRTLVRATVQNRGAPALSGMLTHRP